MNINEVYEIKIKNENLISNSSFSNVYQKCSQLPFSFIPINLINASSTHSNRENINENNQEKYPEISKAIDKVKVKLNEDGSLSQELYHKIIEQISDLDTLYPFLLNRPNRKKGKGGRQRAKDPTLDPNMDPRKAKRIMANRLSAARSKYKQKQQVEGLKSQHDFYAIQSFVCHREIKRIKRDNSNTELEINLLDIELQAVTQHNESSDEEINKLIEYRDKLKMNLETYQAYQTCHINGKQ